MIVNKMEMKLKDMYRRRFVNKFSNNIGQIKVIVE